MIHSPFGVLSPALTASANTDNEAIRRRRFIEFEGRQYLCRKRKCATRWRSFSFTANQVLPALSFSDQRDLVATHQCVRAQRTGIVIEPDHTHVRASTHAHSQLP